MVLLETFSKLGLPPYHFPKVLRAEAFKTSKVKLSQLRALALQGAL